MNDLSPTSVNKSNPFRDLATQFGEPVTWLRSEIDRLFDDFGKPARNVFGFGSRGLAPVPALELVDDETSYRLTAELPGLTESDVEISISERVLSISGEKKLEERRKENGLLLSERHYGAFQRQVQLPADIDPDGIKAQFKDGILIVTLAKDAKASAQARKIAIEKA